MKAPNPLSSKDWILFFCFFLALCIKSSLPGKSKTAGLAVPVATCWKNFSGSRTVLLGRGCLQLGRAGRFWQQWFLNLRGFVPWLGCAWKLWRCTTDRLGWTMRYRHGMRFRFLQFCFGVAAPGLGKNCTRSQATEQDQSLNNSNCLV